MIQNELTVSALITDVQQRCGSASSLPTSFLLREYNAFIRTLTMQKPTADAVLTASAENGVIRTDLAAAQIRRVLTENGELIPASRGLYELLCDEPLCRIADGEIFVRTEEPCRILYRALPDPVKAEDVQTAKVYALPEELPLVYTALSLRSYERIGSTTDDGVENINACRAEYKRLYGIFCAQNHVTPLQTEVTV